MLSLMEQVMPLCGLKNASEWPNSCSVNLYLDGSNSVDWHSDDQAMFQGRSSDCRIVSLSLGMQRRFELRLNWPSLKDARSMAWVGLGDGDLLTMEGMTQKHLQHRVPPQLGLIGPRINLTWRWIVEPYFSSAPPPPPLPPTDAQPAFSKARVATPPPGIAAQLEAGAANSEEVEKQATPDTIVEPAAGLPAEASNGEIEKEAEAADIPEAEKLATPNTIVEALPVQAAASNELKAEEQAAPNPVVAQAVSPNGVEVEQQTPSNAAIDAPTVQAGVPDEVTAEKQATPNPIGEEAAPSNGAELDKQASPNTMVEQQPSSAGAADDVEVEMLEGDIEELPAAGDDGSATEPEDDLD